MCVCVCVCVGGWVCVCVCVKCGRVVQTLKPALTILLQALNHQHAIDLV